MLFKGVVSFFVFVVATNHLQRLSKALPPRKSFYESPLYPWEGLPPIYGLLPRDFPIQGFADDPGVEDDPESIRWIFWLKSGVASAELDTVCKAGATHQHRCIKYHHTILGASTQMTVSELKDFLDEHGETVQSVYRDGKLEGLSSLNGFQDGKDLPWHLDRIDQDNRHLDSNFVYPTLGSGVAIYIVDTGIQTTHNEFKHIDGTAGTRASFAFSVFNDADDGGDCNGHGTHVAGIAAGLTYGAAKNASLFDVRALDCSKASVLSDTLSGLEWVAQNHVKPAVAVLSLGGGANSLLDASVQALYDLDVTVVTAAGNSAEDACTWSPARSQHCLTVAASTPGDFLYETSNFGSCVDVVAPGDMILSAGTGDDDEGVYQSGTSMATPLVAGIAALYLQAFPAAPPSDVIDAVLQSSVPDELRDLASDTTNTLANVKSLVETVIFDPEEVTLTYGGDTVEAATFNVSLASSPASEVDVTLVVANVVFGSVEPSTIIFGPDNWTDPATARFIPRRSRFPVGDVLVVVAEAREGNSLPVAHGLRLHDDHIAQLGNALNRGFQIDEIPFQGSAFSSQFSSEVNFRCSDDEAEIWDSADIIYEFTPATNATVEVDLCDSFFTPKVIVSKGNSSTISNPLVCESGMNGCPPDGAANKPSFQMEAGEKYHIIVDGVNGTAGMVTLRINEENGRRVAQLLPPPPPQTIQSPPPPEAGSGTPETGGDITNNSDQENSGFVEETLDIKLFGISTSIRLLYVIIGACSLFGSCCCLCCCCWCMQESKATPEFQAFKKSKTMREKFKHGAATMKATRTNMGHTVKNTVSKITRPRQKLQKTLHAVRGVVAARRGMRSLQTPSSSQPQAFNNSAASLLDFVRKGSSTPPKPKSTAPPAKTNRWNRFGGRLTPVTRFLRIGRNKESKIGPTPDSAAAAKQNVLLASFLPTKQKPSCGQAGGLLTPNTPNTTTRVGTLSQSTISCGANSCSPMHMMVNIPERLGDGSKGTGKARAEFSELSEIS